MLPQRTAGGLPLRGCFLRGRRGIILPAFLRVKRDFFGLLPIGKAVSLSPILANGRTFFPLILRVKRDFYSAFCHSAGGGFFRRALSSRQVFPSADFCKSKDIFPAGFADQAGFLFCLLPNGGRRVFPPGFILSAGFPPPLIFAKARASFPLILRRF